MINERFVAGPAGLDQLTLVLQNSYPGLIARFLCDSLPLQKHAARGTPRYVHPWFCASDSRLVGASLIVLPSRDDPNNTGQIRNSVVGNRRMLLTTRGKLVLMRQLDLDFEDVSLFYRLTFLFTDGARRPMIQWGMFAMQLASCDWFVTRSSTVHSARPSSQ